MKISLKISIARLIIVQLIPIIGLIFFNRTLFEIAMTYVIETCAIFFVFNIDNYFITNPKQHSKIAAIIEVPLILGFFVCIMILFIPLLYGICNPTGPARPEDIVFPILFKMRVFEILVAFIVLEFIVFYAKTKKEMKHPDDNYWRLMGRFVFLYLFVYFGAALFSSAYFSPTFGYAAFILIKLGYDIYLLGKTPAPIRSK